MVYKFLLILRSTRYQIRSFAPTPNKGIKRKFVENFDVYNLDEYRTSKLHWETEKEGDNLKVKDKDGRLRKKHAIKTFTMKKNPNRLGCINRDRNACLNMWKLVSHYLDTGQWLSAYKRSRKRSTEKTTIGLRIKEIPTKSKVFRNEDEARDSKSVRVGVI